jgi:predicted DNA repair protein MutK
MNPNVVILSAVISVLTIVLAIFGAAWLNQRGVEKQLEQMEKRFDARFDTVTARFDSLEKRFDERFKSLEQRLIKVEDQLAKIFRPILPGAD